MATNKKTQKPLKEENGAENLGGESASEDGDLSEKKPPEPWFGGAELDYSLPEDAIISRHFVFVFDILYRLHAFFQNHEEHYSNRPYESYLSVRLYMTLGAAKLWLKTISDKPDYLIGLSSFRMGETCYQFFQQIKSDIDVNTYPEDKRKFNYLKFPLEVEDEKTMKLIDSSNRGLWLEGIEQQFRHLEDSFDEIRSGKKYSNYLAKFGNVETARNLEGVTNERSYPMSEESKLDKAELAPIFEGELDRDAMAEALSAAMKEQGLSVRKTAAAVETSTNDIQRITKGTATLDKAAEVLSNLGYELHVEVRRADHS